MICPHGYRIEEGELIFCEQCKIARWNELPTDEDIDIIVRELTIGWCSDEGYQISPDNLDAMWEQYKLSDPYVTDFKRVRSAFEKIKARRQ